LIDIRESYLGKFDKVKIDTLNRAIKHAPFTGWSFNTLEIALIEIDKLKFIDNLFPDGIVDLTNFFSEVADKKLEFDTKNIKLEECSIRERIKILLNLRLDFFSRDKQVVKQIIGSDFFVKNNFRSINRISNSVDLMWILAGDKSLDYNYYTKRILLGGIYATTILYWLDAEDRADVSNFIDRRISNIMEFEKIKKNIKNIFETNKLKFPFKFSV
tara:strand:+ start:1405 stop:2049 length:645 start_codon:yes stop_codon:yes gene_type:complete